MIEEFQEVSSVSESQKHHENTPAIQIAFAKDIVNLVSSFEELGIPFKEVREDLIALHTKDVMNEEALRTVRTVRQLGEQQFKAFL